MKTFYALIGVTVTIGTAWVVGLVQGAYTVAKVCGVSRDTDLGDKLNDMVDTFVAIKGAVKEEEHDMLS